MNKLTILAAIALVAVACDNPNSPTPDDARILQMPTAFSVGMPPASNLRPKPIGPFLIDQGPTGTLIAHVTNRITGEPVYMARLTTGQDDWDYIVNQSGLVHVRVRTDMPVSVEIGAENYAVLSVTIPAIGAGEVGRVGAFGGPSSSWSFQMQPWCGDKPCGEVVIK